MEHELIFEVIVHSKFASPAFAEKLKQRMVDAVGKVPAATLLNVPEITDENHEGKPYSRNANVKDFAKWIKGETGREVLINSVVVHHEPKEKFEEWLDDTIAAGINNFVFVGGKLPNIDYPGPDVVEADEIASTKGVNFGNICIPNRPHEVERLLAKTKAGCNFFTTQNIFEPGKFVEVLNEYGKRCKEEGIEPAKVFLSFAPLANKEDFNFLRWLGAVISEDCEKKLLTADDCGQESIKHLCEVYETVKEGVTEVSLGLNVGCITLHNLDLSVELANALANAHSL